ncbi:MAG: hypothetical protein NTV24_02885 [Candidatus Woesebacteria bacterium]|nr:hypothetical protein [Candidatus Woesebacteria bacterium]
MKTVKIEDDWKNYNKKLYTRIVLLFGAALLAMFILTNVFHLTDGEAISTISGIAIGVIFTLMFTKKL